jgi:hypothetical protein
LTHSGLADGLTAAEARLLLKDAGSDVPTKTVPRTVPDHVGGMAVFAYGAWSGVDGGLPLESVAAQIGADDREVLGQDWGDAVPHDVGLWKPVQEQQRRATVLAKEEDGRLANDNLARFKAFEHVELRESDAVRIGFDYRLIDRLAIRVCGPCPSLTFAASSFLISG